MERTGSIYIIKNTINDKVYIGQTTMTVHERFLSHLKPSVHKTRGSYKIYNAMNKYGKENFYVETLEDNVPISELNDKEIAYISKYDSYENGYNSTAGGNSRRIYQIQDVEHIIEMMNNGSKAEEIAKIYNVNRATIFRLLHSMGYFFHDQINDEELIELFNQGYSNQELADMLDTKKWTIVRRLQKLGLRRRRLYVQYRTDINPEEVINDYELGMTVKEICQKYDLDEKTYRKIKDDYYSASKRSDDY